MTYQIFYTRPYNPYRRYFQNANRNMACYIARSEESLILKLAEIAEKAEIGYKLDSVYDGCGRKVDIERV